MTTEMQNYKIKVANEAESREVQELFFEWGFGGKIIQDAANTIYAIFGIMQLKGQFYTNEENIVFQELTLSQLRDIAVLHRNDVSDATHVSEDGEMYYISSDVYSWRGEGWNQTSVLTPELQPQMTWQDALRAVAEGKEVEAYSDLTLEWFSISSTTIGSIKDSQSKFRLAPQRKTLNDWANGYIEKSAVILE